MAIALGVLTAAVEGSGEAGVINSMGNRIAGIRTRVVISQDELKHTKALWARAMIRGLRALDSSDSSSSASESESESRSSSTASESGSMPSGSGTYVYDDLSGSE